MQFFSAQTRGFYDERVHGPQFLTSPDPQWVQPADDPEAMPPTVQLRNPRIPEDARPVTPERHAELFDAVSRLGVEIGADANGDPVTVPRVLTQQQQFDAISAALTEVLEREAKRRRYGNLLSACSYASQAPGAPFQAEGAAFVAWRSAVWKEAGRREQLILAGQASMPTIAEAVAAMPPLGLPG